jgi:SpoVK/Ycf46/Vps4 family AAA+-type ATPase
MQATEADQQRFEHLLNARHRCVVVISNEEDYALSIVRHAALQLGRRIRTWSIIGGVHDGIVSDTPPIPETEHAAAALFLLTKDMEPGDVCIALDIAEHLKDARTLRLLRDMLRKLYETGSSLVLIDHRDTIPTIIASDATPFEITLPGEEEIKSIVRATLKKLHEEKPIAFDISKRGWRTIIRNLSGLTRRQAERIITDCVAEDRTLDSEDINTVLAEKRRALSGMGLLQFVETPVTLNAIGGLSNLKRWLANRENAMTEAGSKFGLAVPRGILLLGVQGAGKSLCAKAIAAAWQRPLLRLDVGALYDKYIGESEKRLRDALRQAESMAPIILWIDEIEKAFASSAARSSDGGLSQRMFGTLLTWMQEHVEPVFLVATANDIEALPPELLRKGRFDEIFFVDLPKNETRREIFDIHLKKRDRKPDEFDLDQLATASDGFSGAEIEQAVISGLHEAFASNKKLDTTRLIEVLKNSPPLSVTMAEGVQQLRNWAKKRCVPAD